MITSYRNKAYLLICEKFQKDKHCRLAVRQVSMAMFTLGARARCPSTIIAEH